MRNWKGILSDTDEPQTDSMSLPVGNGVFSFIRLNIGGRVAYSASEDSVQTLQVRFA